MSAVRLDVPATFDWKAPDYEGVFRERLARLARIRSNPGRLPEVIAYYRSHPVSFLQHWSVTSDPRNALLSPPRPVLTPFVLFPKQVECAHWILDRAKARESALIEKSRDCGISWLAVTLAATLCLFRNNLTIGFGSAKEDKVDRSGDPDCLFWKIRTFLRNLPPELRGGWEESKHSAHMRIQFPATGSAIVGEAGDNIGRGGRSSIFFIDEAAHLERPQLVDASLASNTDCRIDISTPHGRANSFATKRFNGNVKVFTFSWRDDPRKDDDWYARKASELDPVTLAQEVDLDYSASVEGVLIPSAWVQAAINAHVKLGITPSGSRRAGLDVADEGVDRNCFAARHGILLYGLESWSGRGSDIYQTTLRAFDCADRFESLYVDFDADGLGAGVRGDARRVSKDREVAALRTIIFEQYRGSSSPWDPERQMVPGRKNLDYFSNRKAQAWWHLRRRFENSFRAVVHGLKVDPDEIVSIDPKLPELGQLIVQLSQPTYSLNSAGKVVVDKRPDGAGSPDRADAVMIAYQLSNRGGLETWAKLGELVRRGR